MIQITQPFIVAAWAEEFDDLYGFDTLIEARAWSDGWGSGAGKYGAGKTVTYVLPDDLEELKSNPEDYDDVKDAYEKLGMSLEATHE